MTQKKEKGLLTNEFESVSEYLENIGTFKFRN
jgi:hypothetical protein